MSSRTWWGSIGSATRARPVDPSARHRGLGRTLLQRLVTNRIPAVLITHPDAEARRLYEATGWRRVGQVTSPDSPEWLVYVFDTAGER